MSKRLWQMVVPMILITVGVPAYAGENSGNSDVVIVGAGVSVVPTYEGSNAYRIRPLPLITAEYGRFFVDPLNGIGIKAVETQTVTIGASLSFVPGYRAQDVPLGLHHIPDTMGGRVFGTYHFGKFQANLGATRSINGTKGTTVDANLAYIVPVGRLTIMPSIATSWANERYMDRYFGIDQTEAGRSGLPVFHAGAGFKDVSATVSLSYRINHHWLATANIGGMRVLGDAVDSPLNRTRWDAVAFTGIAYQF